ncbi:MAG: ribosome maturation factor RimM [Propionicimonas sp.]|uniref:ribosome maturation factor RimM n=1 Tax=Propionicimonas sp. TaxID=1955623 RepID=UPI002B212620|nr:ribosome maturation factor RimM [Propionicimonas sp.]MEA4944297.1 ribosome maturation factor RimM [Propionicimonas sp.]
MAADTMDVLVGRVGRAHGLRGEVTVQTTTDSPELRFAPGSRLYSEAGRPLTVRSSRQQAGTWVLAFEQAGDRSAAEALRGTELWAALAPGQAGDPDGAFHDTALIGLAVVDPDGQPLGRVTRILHLPAQDLLAVGTPAGERLVPFVEALVPEVDLARGQVVVTPIPGLLDDDAQTVAPEPPRTEPEGHTDAL